MPQSGPDPDAVRGVPRREMPSDDDVDAVVARLSALGPPAPEPIPDAARVKIDAALDAVRADVQSRVPTAPIDIAARRRKQRNRLVVGGAVAATVAGVVAAVVLTGTGSAPDRPSVDARSPGTSQPSSQQIPQRQLLAVVGKTAPAPFSDVAARGRCLAANGYRADTPVLGSGPITARDQPAAVILIATGTAGRFTALVVGTDCGTDRPSTISRTVIGG